MQFGTRKQFEYFRCTGCGCLQISRIPINLAEFYPEDYYSFKPQARPKKHGWFYQQAQRLRVRNRLVWHVPAIESVSWRFIELPYEWQECISYLPQPLPHGMKTRFLDVGCGEVSWWLRSLHTLGFTDLTGADPFMKKDHALHGARYVRRSIAEIHGSFDCLSLHHSLEHIPDQLGALTAARRLLSDQGLCIVRIPMIPSYLWDKYGLDWMGLDAPRHLYLHTRESMRVLAREAGFEIEKIFFDMDEVTLIASEQYTMDIPMFDDRSFLVQPENSPISLEQANAFRRLAKELNESERADCAALLLRPTGSRSEHA